MNIFQYGFSGILYLLTIVGCGQPIKNPGGSEHSGGWAETLTVDPAARIGQDFWITYTLTMLDYTAKAQDFG